MQIRYIFHSGFLVETAQSYYLFDYYRGALPALDAAKPIVALVSHNHADHYNPAVFSALRAMGMQDVRAVLAKDILKRRYPPDTEVLRACANEEYVLPFGAVLETLRSTDCGVAYLLTTDEGVLFHAGDLNDWTWAGEEESKNRQMRGSYRHEIDKLKNRPVDAAFLPLDPRQEAHYADGLLYFLSKVDTKAVYPMHYWEQPQVIERFLYDYPQYREIVKDTERMK
ncbi:MAG: MBL fold metallo-hydrolase [Eubacteriales bacterium]|nr:MBL fold metallo-hydrolase [Eubacteriales bacterium]